MDEYAVHVTEVVYRPVIYRVAANTPEEAIAKAAMGDTVSECADGSVEIGDRVVQDLPHELEPSKN